MNFREKCYLMFPSPSVDLGEAGALLTDRGFTVEEADSNELRCECNGIEFWLTRHEGPKIQRESAMIGDLLNNPVEIDQCDCRFEIEFEDLEKVLDEINSLIEIQLTLQDATNAYLFNLRNRGVQPPDSLKHQEETTEFPINSVREIAKEINKVTKTWGFKRSGNNFRGIVGDAAVVLNLQKFTGSDSFCMNTGVIPLVFCDVRNIDPTKLGEPSCTFRTRDFPLPGWAVRPQMGPRTLESYKAALGFLKNETIDPKAALARPGLMATIDSMEWDHSNEPYLIHDLVQQKNFDAAIAVAEKGVATFQNLQHVPKYRDHKLRLDRIVDQMKWWQNRVAELRQTQANQ
ncbi:MAG: hypothetical protein ACI8P0_003042 [Planctomycetaceae bacterium]|jgi:hypothetical protein